MIEALFWPVVSLIGVLAGWLILGAVCAQVDKDRPIQYALRED